MEKIKFRKPGALRRFASLALVLAVAITSIAAFAATASAKAKYKGPCWVIYQVTLEKSSFTYNKAKQGPKIKSVDAYYVDKKGKIGRKTTISSKNYSIHGTKKAVKLGTYSISIWGEGKLNGVPVDGYASREWTIAMGSFTSNDVSFSYANKAKTKVKITILNPVCDYIDYAVYDDTTGQQVIPSNPYWTNFTLINPGKHKTVLTVKIGKPDNHIYNVLVRPTVKIKKAGSCWITDFKNVEKKFSHPKN